jgi:hypothetical protein
LGGIRGVRRATPKAAWSMRWSLHLCGGQRVSTDGIIAIHMSLAKPGRDAVRILSAGEGQFLGMVGRWLVDACGM